MSCSTKPPGLRWGPACLQQVGHPRVRRAVHGCGVDADGAAPQLHDADDRPAGPAVLAELAAHRQPHGAVRRHRYPAPLPPPDPGRLHEASVWEVQHRGDQGVVRIGPGGSTQDNIQFIINENTSLSTRWITYFVCPILAKAHILYVLGGLIRI